MAVNLTVTPSYFLRQDTETQRPPVSELEISGMFKPEYLGRVIADKLDNTSLVAQLLMQGREFTSSISQVTWKEEGNTYSRNKVSGAGLVTRTVNDFLINTAAIPTDAYDIDSNRPDQAQWIVKPGMEFMVVDSTGKMDYGKITAVSVDGKTMTATPLTVGGVWTIDTTNIDIFFTSYNLDNCECPPCIGWKDYAPSRMNTMTKDGECVSYCEETSIEEGAGAYDLFEVKGQYMYVDEKLNNSQKSLLERMEYAIAFSKRLTEAQATAAGQVSRGMEGLFPTLEGRAKKHEGFIETLADLRAIASYLKKEKITSATIRCSLEQMDKLQALVTPTSPYFFSPFENHESDLVYLDFGGIKISGVTLIFKEWTALADASDNLSKRYNFVVIPEDTLTRVINGKREKVGYLNIVWFAGNGKTWKFLRDNNENEHNCGNLKYDIVNKFTITVFMPEKFILGINTPA